jgi:uncharacterized membrane protein YdjX (TVP38/TMEM64 family)
MMITRDRESTVNQRGKVIFKIILLIAVTLLFVVLQFTFDVVQFLQPEAVKSRLAGMGLWAPLAYTAVMALVVATPLPSLPLNIAAGAYFGPLAGTLLSVTGATLGALISFFLARFFGREAIERYLKGHINFCSSCSDRLLTKLVLLGRLIPVLSFDLISYGAGLTKMSARNFAVANFIGMLPLTFIYNYYGSMVTINTGVSIILGLLFMALFFLLPRWIERYDVLSLRRFFRHLPGEQSPGDCKERKSP